MPNPESLSSDQYISQLQREIETLRDGHRAGLEALEAAKNERASAMLDLTHSFDSEIVHLKETVQALRETLEKQRLQNLADQEATHTQHIREVTQLQKAIDELRRQLEGREIYHQQKNSQLAQTEENEKGLLRETISSLRLALEQQNAQPTK